jgi:uncharacterized protein
VRDDAPFFSTDATSQANQIIRRIQSTHRKDVLVQTYPSIPDRLKGDYEAQGKARFFETWAENIGRENKVNGIVIVICKDPSHLDAVIGQDTRQKAFTDDDRRDLVSQLLASFKSKEFDRGLIDGVKLISDRMDRHLGSGAVSGSAAPSSGGATPAYPGNTGSSRSVPTTGGGGFSMGGMLCVGIGALLVLFIVTRLFNRNRGAGYGGPAGGGYPQQGGYQGQGGGYPPGGYPQGGGGGGFGRGLLGGLLGGAIGSWGYDKLSHRGGADPGYPSSGGAGPTNDTGGVDTSYSGSGGDFGSPDTSSGGDFSSSGGDFGGGGGDSGGGGGGDSGGGGGGDF